MDAAVDFRAVVEPPDEAWLTEQAVARARRELGDQYSKVSVDERRQRIKDAKEAVQTDLGEMWNALADELAKKNATSERRDRGAAMEEIEAIRRATVERVRMRRRYVWYHKYQRAVEEQKGVTAPWYAKWLLEGDAEGPDVDNFLEDVGEQEAPHPIIHDIDNDAFIRLKKNLDRYPGLSFPPSTVRHYPYNNVAAHVIGRLSKVMSEDIASEENRKASDLRVYQKNDLIGRTGLEALCEPALRGSRGEVVRVVGENTEMSRTEDAPGGDVRTTLDMEFQRDIEALFKHVAIEKKKKYPEDPNSHEYYEVFAEMHGAAVVIDVPTGAVRALASWPNYDANKFDDMYDEWRRDEQNQRLLNRATQWAIEPGSTVKPMVGMGAITDGKLGVNEGIECTGYLNLNGHTYKTSHRCWTARMFSADPKAGAVAHHQIPWYAPHKGHDGNADGFLTYSDALMRSCNVYFETVAWKLGIDGLHKWFSAFGLGRPTGIGIAESRGWLPTGEGMARQAMLGDTLNAGIGQGQVGATALQMANVSATIARNGMWVRPYLVEKDVPTTRPTGLAPEGPDRVDLHIAPEALAAARKGMFEVVNEDGGTLGYDALANRKDVVLAGKTGSAQAPKFRTPARDARGDLIFDIVEDPTAKDGKRRQLRRTEYEPVSEQNPDGLLKWYRGFGKEGKTLSHAWFIGFAPYDNPKVALAVMVEYGGSGGYAAGSVADGVITACLKHGYLAPVQAKTAAGASVGMQ
jgi:penicillin-binding protein 2